VTRLKLIPEGSTAASMPPTVTVATMAILTIIELFIWLKAYAPFRVSARYLNRKFLLLLPYKRFKANSQRSAILV
jgi:hypothetical protein